jgi:hypothetical protein
VDDVTGWHQELGGEVVGLLLDFLNSRHLVAMVLTTLRTGPLEALVRIGDRQPEDPSGTPRTALRRFIISGLAGWLLTRIGSPLLP